MEKRTLGLMLFHFMCCGFIFAITIGGLGLLKNNLFLVGIAIVILLVSVYLMFKHNKE